MDSTPYTVQNRVRKERCGDEWWELTFKNTEGETINRVWDPTETHFHRSVLPQWNDVRSLDWILTHTDEA